MNQNTQNNKVALVLDDESARILNTISPALRNAAMLVALKMFSESSIYKNYFCEGCEKEQPEHTEDIADISGESAPAQDSGVKPIVSFDDFATF